MDSNADTCCAGSNFIVLSLTRRTADVYPYNSSYDPVCNVPIVTAATAFDDKDSSSTYILVLHECLYYGTKLDHSLINPNQLRHGGTSVWDNPYDPDRIPCIECTDDLTIPLTFQGTKATFISRSPTEQELNDCVHIHLTSSYEWEPHNVQLSIRSVTNYNTATCWNNQPVNIGQLSTDAAVRGLYKSYEYNSNFLSNDETVLHSIEPSLVSIAELHSARNTYKSQSKHQRVDANTIAKLWGIGFNRAKATLNCTTQRGSRSAILPLSRRYRADRMYSMKRLNAKFATDTFYSDYKSINQNTCAQIYSHKNGFAAVYPLENATGDSIGQSLATFSNDFGIPEHLTFDGAMAQVGKNTLFMKNIRKYQCRYHVSSPRRPNENPAEAGIRALKLRWYRIMHKKEVPRRLWDFGLVWIAETGNLISTSSRYSDNRTPIEIITGDTPDISEYMDFGFYDWVTYRPNAGLGENSLGRWLGVSHKVGQLLSYWILTVSGRVISCTTVQRLSESEQATDDWIERMKNYDAKVKEQINTIGQDLSHKIVNIEEWNKLSTESIDQEFIDEFNKVIDDKTLPNMDDLTIDNYNDEYINMEIGLPRGDDNELMHATVKRRKTDDDGNNIGSKNNNPILDSRLYEVEFIDGTVEALTANVIAENLLAQVDAEGHRQLMLDEIVDHRSNDKAITKEDGFTTTPHGTRRRKLTTRGWELCVNWKDGSSNWVALKDLKDSYPIELAEYSINNKIDNEPAFAWWVPYVKKKSKTMISKIKSKYWQRTHKYGIRIPKTVEEAYELDKKNGNTFWADGINEERKKVMVSFEESREQDPSKLIGYQEISTHWIFDIKLGENFRRKARLVADGHKTATPASVTYSTVVSRDSVRICLMLAALNGLDVMSADIENAYLTAPCRERIWTRLGPEFGNTEGKIYIIVRALYGLKSSGAAFRAFLAERLDEMNFRSTNVDPDVWLRPSVKHDGEKYYEYVLVYVDDILTISHKPKEVMLEVGEKFKFKKGDISPPEIYLGGRLEKKPLNGQEMWTLTSKDYIKAIIDNLEQRLKKRGDKLSNKAITPMTQDYQPELDASDELNGDDITMYQELIGELRWAIEIGRVDILHEVSLLSAYQAAPRRGHLEQLLHIFAYLKRKPKLTLYFDPQEPKIDGNTFDGSRKDEFRDIYRDAEEQLPDRMPEPLGRAVSTTAFVDASHAQDKKTRRSHTGYVIFVNRAPILWYSKRQTTVETSTFSSEFIALKTCTEAITGLRVKLRMFGVPVLEETKILCDNLSTVRNSSRIESTLNKKHSAIAYHAVRWAVAAGIILVGWIETGCNIADPFTKRLTHMQRERLFGDWTY